MVNMGLGGHISWKKCLEIVSVLVQSNRHTFSVIYTSILEESTSSHNLGDSLMGCNNLNR